MYSRRDGTGAFGSGRPFLVQNDRGPASVIVSLDQVYRNKDFWVYCTRKKRREKKKQEPRHRAEYRHQQSNRHCYKKLLSQVKGDIVVGYHR